MHICFLWFCSTTFRASSCHGQRGAPYVRRVLLNPDSKTSIELQCGIPNIQMHNALFTKIISNQRGTDSVPAVRFQPFASSCSVAAIRFQCPGSRYSVALLGSIHSIQAIRFQSFSSNSSAPGLHQFQFFSSRSSVSVLRLPVS